MAKKIKREDIYKGAEIKCLKCGTANAPDRVFCNACGAKLPLNHNPFDSAPRPSRVKPLIKAVSHIVSILVIVAVALAFWPAERVGLEGKSRNREDFERKTQDLLDAIEAGREFTVIVNEAEINAFLEQKLEDYLEQNRFSSGAVLQDVRMMLNPEFVMVQVQTKHGPLAFTRSVRGVPRIVDDQFVFDVDKISVGILPLPLELGKFIAEPLRNVFAGDGPGLQIVGNLSGIELSETKIKLMVD
jgi:hypothetical protein